MHDFVEITNEMVEDVKSDLKFLYQKMNYNCMNLSNFHKKESLIKQYMRLKNMRDELIEHYYQHDYTTTRFLSTMMDEMKQFDQRLNRC